MTSRGSQKSKRQGIAASPGNCKYGIAGGDLKPGNCSFFFAKIKCRYGRFSRKSV